MASIKDLFLKIAEKPQEEAPPREEPDLVLQEALKAEKRFGHFNRARHAKLKKQVGERAVQALAALPFMLHTNCEGLPGYTEGLSCPNGIVGYEASSSDMELIHRLFPKASPRRTPVLKMAIDMIAVMGSAGSIGFTDASDLDIWICFRLSEHNGLALTILRQKVAEIEEWMNKYSGVEIHLFVQPTENIRENNFGTIDIEGCGSALGTLLKEEFYRTAIVLAGKPPLWWVMPSGLSSEEYGERVSLLKETGGFDSHAYVDLGPVDRVVLGELFGAAIWQIAKGQKSPFKSALKMGYLEKTVCERDTAVPLCEILKSQVLSGGMPDPYGLLFDEVLQYYLDKNDLAAQELLAECFYLKTGAAIDPDTLEAEPKDEVEETLKRYIEKWGWGRRKIKRLNDFASWRFEWLKELSNDVDRFFLRSYKRIYDTLAEGGMVRSITDRDLTVIGRTLQVAYRQSPNKMTRIHLMAGGMREPVLSLIEAGLPTGAVEWRLYRGVVNPLTEEENAPNLISSFTDVVELMVWASYNGILGQKTRLLCRPLDRRFSSADLESIAQNLFTFIEDGDKQATEIEDLLKEPLPERMFVVVNIGREESEIVEVSALYQTSWGETFYRRHSGPLAFREFAEQILFNFWSTAPDPSRVNIYAPRRKVSALTSPGARLQKSMNKMMALFGGEPPPERQIRRQILSTAEGFAVIERDSKGFTMKSFPTYEHLKRYLSGVGPWDLLLTGVEDDAERLGELGLIYQTAEKGKVDVFVIERGKRPEICIVDEIGNFYQTVCDDVNPIYTLAKVLVFLRYTFEEVRGQDGNPLGLIAESDCLRIFKMSTEQNLRVYPATHDFMNKVEALGLKPVGLTIEKLPAQGGLSGGYKITWGDEVIRSGQVSHPLEELKKRIAQSRSSEKDYGVYVTRLFLDEQFQKKSCGTFSASGHYLFYKSLIEQRLNS